MLALSLSLFSGITPADAIKVREADLIIKGGTIVTMNAERRIMEDGMIVIQSDKIIAIGNREDIKDNFIAKETIDAKGMIVIPGLINAHTHVPMTLFRGLADDLELDDWLQNHIFPAEAKHVNEAFVRTGTRLGIAEMIKSGITTFCDMYYFEDAIAEETARAGMRAVLAQTIVDMPMPGCPDATLAFTMVEQFINKWKDHPLITPAIGPHAPYTVSTENLIKVKALSDKTEAPVVIHVSETLKEVTGINLQYGKDPVDYLSGIHFLNDRTILAHAVHISKEETDKIKQHGCGVAHCPESNMKLASGVAPVPQMLLKNIPVGLGTDGAASNNDLDLWGEIDMAAKLHKVHTGNPKALPATDAFAMATINGAAALHLDEITGSLETGKKADITIVQGNQLHQVPVYNVYSCLVYATKASDVNTVIINGKVVMKDKVLLTLDEQKVIREVLEYKKRLKY